MIGNGYIKASLPSLPTANIMQTGQTTSYRTGDDISRGRTVNFFTLSQKNPFGNTNRFTDMNGLQVYANGVVIDWSTLGSNNTVLLYYIGNSSTYRNWATSIDLYLSGTIAGLSVWHLWNINEILNVVNLSYKPYKMNYAPFNFGSSSRYFFSSSDFDGTSVYITDLGGTILGASSKTNAYFGVYVRYTTLTELGL